ncbi:hypothetical protein LJC24_05780 [Desulfococcaceae bacterium OttesenSCG-928-F15]|nr:hypothetical protein [Desulfococcaceae bacterium OttesenSCG-928-F15]
MKAHKHLMPRAFAFFFCFFFFSQPLLAQGTGTVHFKSHTQELDARNKVFRMEGDAMLRNDSMELRAKRITIHFVSGGESKNFSGKSVETLRARENVRILQEGILSEGAEAFYTSTKGTLLLKGKPAKVSGTDFHVTGLEILYGQTGEKMDVKGGKEKPSSFYHANNGAPLTIHSSEQHWDMQKGSVLFSGKILAKTETHTLESDELLVTYHRNEEKDSPATVETGRENIIIDTVTAMGRVRITDAQGTGLGDKAVFTENNDTIILTGEPAEVTYKGHKIQGPQIRMNQKTGEMEVSGGASGRLLPKDKK